MFELRLALVSGEYVSELQLRQTLTPREWRDYLARVTSFVAVAPDSRTRSEHALRPYLARLRAADRLQRKGLERRAESAYELAIEALSDLLAEDRGLVSAFDREIIGPADALQIDPYAESVPRLAWSRSPYTRRAHLLSVDAQRRIYLECLRCAELELFCLPGMRQNEARKR